MTTRKPRFGFLVLPFLIGFLVPLVAGPAPDCALAFDLQAYRIHLEQIADLDTATFLERNRPFGPYGRSIPTWSSPPDYFEEVSSYLQLTDDETTLLGRHGFVVSERLRKASYGHGLLDVWHADLPVYLSTDVFLHALHRSFLQVQKDIEQWLLLAKLQEALDRMHADWEALSARYATTPEMRTCVDDIDVYLAVARTLLAAEPRPARGDNQPVVDDLLARIDSELPSSVALFNEDERIVDFSQFRVRGYYTQHPDLERWFRAMMWLGRIDFRLTRPPGQPETESVDREIVDAFLLRELATTAYVRDRLDTIDRVVRTFVGEPDNTTLDALDQLAQEISLTDPAELWSEPTMAALEARLSTDEYQPQAINSRILLGDPMGGEPLDPPYSFLLMGQRFVIDSYVFWNVVYDRIVYEGSRPFRGLPDPLDALYALGNDDVLPLLEAEMDQHHYAANLSALRYLIDGYQEDFWGASLYGRWLNAIRSLSHTGRQAGAPPFMRTVAWQQEKMNTQLASWAELRHDTLLYAKQSYTGGVICSYPRAYLEPVPEFYHRMREFATTAKTGLGTLGLSGWVIDGAIQFFEGMEQIIDPLVLIAQKELAREPLTAEEVSLLQSALFEETICTTTENGWIRNLYYEAVDTPVSRSDRVIADVHTQPTDEFGAPVGKVLHVGTGDPSLGVFVAETGNWPSTVFVGPVASYHEMVTYSFDRFTDERWSDLYDTEDRPGQPDWTWIYLADAQGAERLGGRTLLNEAVNVIEDPEDPDPTPSPARVVGIRNQPNPFNPSTLIVFRLEGVVSATVNVAVVDVRGRHVRTLLQDRLAAGREHIVEWQGNDARDRNVASGVYHVVITVEGEGAVHHKVSLVR